MVTLLDGPDEVAGRILPLRRAPTFLRVVVDHEGHVDGLDQVDDGPRDDEAVFVFRKLPGTGGHTCTRDGRGCFEMGSYRFVADAEPEPWLRQQKDWQAWVNDRAERERREDRLAYEPDPTAAQ